MIGYELIATNCMEAIDRQSLPVQLSKLIFQVINSSGSYEESVVHEHVERHKTKVKENIADAIVEKNREGKTCSFCFSPSDTPFLQGVDFVNVDDDDLIREAKQARKNIEDIRSSILKMSANHFEVLMGSILKGLGVSDVFITPSRSDDGIDFIGRLNVGVVSEYLYLEDSFAHELDLFIVGQAKRYVNSAFKLAELRELVGSVVLLKSNVSARVNKIDWPFRIRVSDPVLNLFVISNDISDSGWRLANESGVKLLDIEKLSLLIADLKVDIPK